MRDTKQPSGPFFVLPKIASHYFLNTVSLSKKFFYIN